MKACQSCGSKRQVLGDTCIKCRRGRPEPEPPPPPCVLTYGEVMRGAFEILAKDEAFMRDLRIFIDREKAREAAEKKALEDMGPQRN